MSTKTALELIIIPGAYWIQTRLPRTGQKLRYLPDVIFPQFFGLIILSGPSLSLFGLFCLYFIGMISIYELGYFDNDYRAQKKEKAAGLYVRKKEPQPIGIFGWILAIGSRLLILIGVNNNSLECHKGQHFTLCDISYIISNYFWYPQLDS